jgi:hypothetical protein
MRTAPDEVLEAEMTGALGVEKDKLTARRRGYRSGLTRLAGSPTITLARVSRETRYR